MKVSINTKNAPLPFVGALVSAGAGIAGAGINAASNAALQDKQMKHDKDMAAINQQYNQQNMAKQHEYNLASMEQQNQYQLDQWNRENEYNDPSAVAKRYRDAGINPRAAFGNGSASGAGVAGGFSGAPSGGAPSGSGSLGSASSLPGGNQFAGLSSIGFDAVSASVNLRRAEADARLAEERAEHVSLQNARERFLQDNGDLFRELNEKGWKADVAQIEAFKARVDKAWYRFEKQQAFDIGQAELDNLGSQLAKYSAEVEKLRADKKISEQTYQNLIDENKIIQERYNTQKEVTETQKQLTEEVKARKSLEDARVDKLIAETYQGWVSLGIEGAQVILQLVDIIGGLMPKKSKSQIKQEVEEIVKTNGKGKVISKTTKSKDTLVE